MSDSRLRSSPCPQRIGRWSEIARQSVINLLGDRDGLDGFTYLLLLRRCRFWLLLWWGRLWRRLMLALQGGLLAPAKQHFATPSKIDPFEHDEFRSLFRDVQPLYRHFP